MKLKYYKTYLFFFYQAHMLTLNTILLPTLCLHVVSLQRHILKLLMNVTDSQVHTKKSEYVPFALYLHMNVYVYNNSSVPSQPNLRFSTSHGI
jgi:F0F1-type ATP synthase membrane subunit a